MERENSGKMGRPYEYPTEFFAYLAKIRSLWSVPFRALEAWVREPSKTTCRFLHLRCVAIFRRIREVPVETAMNEISRDVGDNIAVIIDSGGLKTAERGGGLSTKRKEKRRRWIKVHVVIDKDTMNVVSFNVKNKIDLTPKNSGML